MTPFTVKTVTGKRPPLRAPLQAPKSKAQSTVLHCATVRDLGDIPAPRFAGFGGYKRPKAKHRAEHAEGRENYHPEAWSWSGVSSGCLQGKPVKPGTRDQIHTRASPGM